MTNEQQTENQRSLTYYCKRFAELNVSSNKKRGDAHYKPILLLTIIDLITQGLIPENRIFVSDDLINTFKRYWDILGSASYQGGLHYPFFHLQSEGFWHIQVKEGFNNLQPKTTNKLKQAVDFAYLDQALFNFLQDPLSRKELVDALVFAWFSSNTEGLEQLLEVNQNFQDSSEEEQETAEAETSSDQIPKYNLRKSLVRTAFFRKTIVHIYEYRCAFCGLRVNTSLNQTIVDGAHIKPFALFYDSAIKNGISFCKNHHWAFDRGWFTVDDDYKILITDELEEESPNAKPMKEFQQNVIFLPKAPEYFPSLEALRWHRNNVFIQ